MEDGLEHFYFQVFTLAVILFLGLCLNVLVMATFLFSKTLRQAKHNIFILHLMLCNMIYVLWVIPVSAADLICKTEGCTRYLRQGGVCQVCVLSPLLLFESSEIT